MRTEDWGTVREIYLEGIASGHATFESEAPSWDHWNAAHHPFARLVRLSDKHIVGWAALSPVSQRLVYRGVAEVSVYVSARHRSQGHGRALLEALIRESETNGIWTLQASIFPENLGSLALHRKCGFREVGERVRIAKLSHVWRNTVLLERRSGVVGID